MPVKTRSSGPVPAEIMIVGEAPGAEEEVKGTPFVGVSGAELTKMLHEAGIMREECFLTNVCKYRPPNNDIDSFFLDSKLQQPNDLVKEGITELMQEIEAVKPKVIVAMGNTALWALTGLRGITKWRGSMLTHERSGACLMPTYHPALILREWSWRAIAVHDLRRANAARTNGGWPKRDTRYLVRPSFPDTMDCLGTLLERAKTNQITLASDLETRAGYIACHGIAWSDTEAISIPSMCVERPIGYFTLDQDVALWERTRNLVTHENVEIVGQNYLYDAQYFARRWGYIPRVRHDTMFMQHVAFAGMPKGLDFLSSMYRRYHRYWKDEGKNWNPKLPEDQLWKYNCEDAAATFELRHIMEQALRSLPHQWELYQFQMRLWHHVLKMMLRGVRINVKMRGTLAGELLEALMQREGDVTYMVGKPLNVRSPKQMMGFFYGELRLPIVKHRVTKKATCNEEALQRFAEREPLLRRLVEAISEQRSIGVFLNNFVQAPLDADSRMRSSFNPAGAETYRWTSSENAFGSGTNLQNIPKGDEEKADISPDTLRLPNIRKLFIPDPGYTVASIDLSGADAQTVAWEADDAELKAAFRAGEKIHAKNARDFYGQRAPTGFEQPYYDVMRTGVHLVNYLGSAPTLAAALSKVRGAPYVDSHGGQRFIDHWFKLHPGIREWHIRVEEELMRTRTVTNRFGYRRLYFDRIEYILSEAVAWIGQSQTACICNRAYDAVESHSNGELVKDLDIQFLLQVHDELVFQFPTYRTEEVLRTVKPLIHITVPYDDPLVIPWGLKTSEVSWGECQKRNWPQ